MKWLCIILLFTLSTNNTFKVVYKIDGKSRLYLNGKTSINNYQRYCTDEFAAASLAGTSNDETGIITFSNGNLYIKTSLLSCKNKLMNRDMHKALKAEEHPYIIITLHDAASLNNITKLSINTWYEFTANVTLTIAGVSKKNQLNVMVSKLSNLLFRLKAKKDLLMSDFNVKPRTPFNMIKIEDKVTINFDMTVVVNELN
ncbi:MAG: YceI family protein [Chitinophagaceae bacterium]|nr:YceI family protein [Chitinophagaceae bacterium]